VRSYEGKLLRSQPVDAQARAGILRIEIDDQHSFANRGQRAVARLIGWWSPCRHHPLPATVIIGFVGPAIAAIWVHFALRRGPRNLKDDRVRFESAYKLLPDESPPAMGATLTSPLIIPPCAETVDIFYLGRPELRVPQQKIQITQKGALKPRQLADWNVDSQCVTL